jgi:NADH-quinone oxidoreductase subunit N
MSGLTSFGARIYGADGLVLPHVNYSTILPELILLGGMLFMLGISAMRVRQFSTQFYASMTVLIGIAALLSSLSLWRDIEHHGPFSAIAKSIDIDGFAVFFFVLVSVILIISSIVGAGYLQREHIGGCEYYALALISSSGAMLMGSANDLILIFLSLEILSIPLYVMAGMDQRREASSEAAMKYFVLGAFSSAIFVYGIALTYGATGSTNLADIAAFLAKNDVIANGVLLGGLGLMLVGFSFKIAAVPFHMWTPDVYQGAPSPVTGFMGAMAKAGGFAALLRVFVSSFPMLREDWQPIVWVLAALTLLVGAILALVQRDMKRMLAYSSINHAGFVLLGLQAASARGVAGSLYYLFIYGLLVIASFAIVDVVGGKGDANHDLAGYRGLYQRQPVLATVFAIVLLAQAGAPFTTGFFAKFYVIEASIDAHSYALAVIAMASAAIATFFYLRVVFLMFGLQSANAAVPRHAKDELAGLSPTMGTLDPVMTMTDVEVETDASLSISTWTKCALFLCVAPTIVFGIWVEPLVSFAHHATLLF